ncbi:hypothetical protein [Streptomyces sp. NK08204]|uniref:hypothetical protein n=1 Tax=Streptomyces sp. NK08204 TaxID=2873260 RepID=UPI001CEDBB2D|nr:hypothetical protein [Streptomyces sp. NK08204]
MTARADAAAPLVDVPSRHTALGKAGPRTGLAALTGAVGHVTGPVADLKPNPLAGTGADLLDDGVSTQLADSKPVNSRTQTGPVAQARSLRAVPVARPATRLPGTGQGASPG